MGVRDLMWLFISLMNWNLFRFKSEYKLNVGVNVWLESFYVLFLMGIDSMLVGVIMLF